jgi:hypothetical protein
MVLKEILYIRGILRYGFEYVNEEMALELLKTSVKFGASINDLKEHAFRSRNRTTWRDSMEKYIQYMGNSETK